MIHPALLASTLLFLGFFSLNTLRAAPPMQKSLPNIVYILADDMGYGDLSCLNPNSKIQTIHLDRLAEQGMRFEDAHASSAVCTPSRYSILTGRYNWRSTLKAGVLKGYSPHLIEPNRMTVASFLKAHGYHTAMIGKWHLGWDWSTTDGKTTQADGGNLDFSGPVRNGPDACGFIDYYGISGSLDMPPYVYVENGKVTERPNRETQNEGFQTVWRKGPTAPHFQHQEALPNFIRRSEAYIQERAASGTPFFLYLPIPAPHTPILPSPEFQGKSGTNAYGDFCLQVDHSVGQIINAIDQAGLSENTILIFTSDNGCSPRAQFEELAAAGHNPSYHFRGHKADIFEGGHRVPLIVRWPKLIQPGSSTNQIVCLSDLLATCSEITGTPLPDNAGEDSVSNLPLWMGDTIDQSLREATVHHSINGSFSIRMGKWKLEMCPDSGGWSYPSPGKDDDFIKSLPSIQLYDLSDDIGERLNLYDQHPQVVQQLKTLLIQYIQNGRSTPGPPQKNTGPQTWEQLHWIQ